MRSVKINAPAKVNLFLEVTGKRKDGYHDLAAIFARIALFDGLTVKKAARPGISLKVENKANAALPGTEDNIVYKAALKFFEAFRIEPAVEIKLLKRIPAGAGLGGGSSDAAAALKALCRLYGVSAARNLEKLRALALELGSDVPFFLGEAAFAAGTGRGELLKPLRFRGPGPAIVLVYPGTPVRTGPVYRALRPAPPAEKAASAVKFKKFIKTLGSGASFNNWSGLLFNRLEGPVLPADRSGRSCPPTVVGPDLQAYQAVREAKEDLVKAGAQAVLMSGSGSSVFALVPGRAAAARLAKSVKKPGRKIFLTNFC